MKENKTGLVLEGGGLRGIFTAGVLDFFLKKMLNLTDVQEYRQERVMRAAIYPNSIKEHIMFLQIIWMIRDTAAFTV